MGRDGPRWGRVWPSLPKAAGDGLPEGRWVAAQRLGERGLAQVVRKREVEAGLRQSADVSPRDALRSSAARCCRLSYRLKPTRIPLVRRDVHRHARRKACASQSRSDVGRLPVEDGAPTTSAVSAQPRVAGRHVDGARRASSGKACASPCLHGGRGWHSRPDRAAAPPSPARLPRARSETEAPATAPPDAACWGRVPDVPRGMRRPARHRHLGVGAHPPPPHEAAADAQHARRPATQQRHSAGGRAPSRHVVVARRRSDRRPADLKEQGRLGGSGVVRVGEGGDVISPPRTSTSPSLTAERLSRSCSIDAEPCHETAGTARLSARTSISREKGTSSSLRPRFRRGPPRPAEAAREGDQLPPRFSHLTVDAVWRNRRQDENTAYMGVRGGQTASSKLRAWESGTHPAERRRPQP